MSRTSRVCEPQTVCTHVGVWSEREELLALYADFLVQTQTRVSVSEPPAPAKGDDYPPLAGLVVIQI